MRRWCFTFIETQTLQIQDPQATAISQAQRQGGSSCCHSSNNDDNNTTFAKANKQSKMQWTWTIAACRCHSTGPCNMRQLQNAVDSDMYSYICVYTNVCSSRKCRRNRCQHNAKNDFQYFIKNFQNSVKMNYKFSIRNWGLNHPYLPQQWTLLQ